jgi:hypothetical protein
MNKRTRTTSPSSVKKALVAKASAPTANSLCQNPEGRFDWWWRKHPDFQLTAEQLFEKYHTDRPFWGYAWKGSLEVAAWNYELVRRYVGVSELKPFPELLFVELLAVCGLWLPDDRRPWRFAVDDKEVSEREWTPPDRRLQWNLRLPDAELATAFSRLLGGLC